MNITTEDYAYLSKDCYHDYYQDSIDGNVSINGKSYKIFDSQNSVDGLHATAYMQVAPPHAVVIAFRGTDPDFKQHTATAFQDVATDVVMVADKANLQALDALAFARRVIGKAEVQGIPPDGVTVTGHSLGGTLAEVVAYRCDVHGQTFNAYGAANLFDIPAGGDQVIDNVLAGDVVSAGGHFGKVRRFATPEDIASLEEGGYLDAEGLDNPFRAMRLSDHSIDNFAPGPGEGPSVLTVANEARAREYAQPVAHFRNDVVALRRQIRIQSLVPGTPAFDMAAAARVAEAGLTAARFEKSFVENAVQGIAGAAASGARAAEHDAQRIGTAVAEGAQWVEGAVAREATSVETRVAATRDELSALLNDVRHPDYFLYQSAFHAVGRMEAGRHIQAGPHSERLAGALTVAARREGLHRIDHVALTKDGSQAWAVEGDPRAPLPKRIHVQTAQAVRTPLAQSTAAMSAARQSAIPGAQAQHARNPDALQAPQPQAGTRVLQGMP